MQTHVERSPEVCETLVLEEDNSWTTKPVIEEREAGCPPWLPMDRGAVGPSRSFLSMGGLLTDVRKAAAAKRTVH